MQARRLPAARGTFWLLEGFLLYRRNPALITALTLTYLLVIQVLVALLPGIGPILLPLLLPTLTLLVANGVRLVDENQLPAKALFVRGLTGNGKAMFQLGLLQLGAAILLVVLNLLFNAGATSLGGVDSLPLTPNMGEAATSANPPNPPVPADSAQAQAQAQAKAAADLGAMARMMLLALPVLLAFWFAHFLVGWDRVSPVKALFFSTVASLRNWRAFGMFGLGALVLAGIFPGMILILIGQIAGMALPVAFVAMQMILVFLVAPILTASVYVSYRDIFHTGVDENA